MISFPCSHCGAALRVSSRRAGAPGRCPRCDRAITIPLKSDFSTVVGKPADRPIAPRSGSGVKRRPAESTRADELAFLAPPQGKDELGRLGNYRVLKVLGSGGMGIVLLAEDLKLKRNVAIKVMKKAVAAVLMHRERFIREAQATAQIEHDHIVPIYQVDEHDGVPFLAMKLLVGESLEERLVRDKTLDPEAVCRIGMEIAEGLAAAHERGLIHRDIKPANIWLEEGRDRVKIVDFGLVQAQDEDVRLTAENYLVGTPQYMSPEQASGDMPLDHRTDLFSLGVVLYRMTTGQLPFTGKTTLNILTALATKQPPPPREVNPAVPRSLSAVIMTMLEKDPDDRPKTARAVVAALSDAAAALDEEEEVVETEVITPPAPYTEVDAGSDARSDPSRPRRPGPRRRRRTTRETDEERLVRKTIRFAIFAGVFVFLLLAFLVIKTVFFKKTEQDGAHPSPPPPVAGRPPAGE
ncbi:MAG: serine/threonine-protein kinase [Gemmataceae bacterium]